MGFLLWGLLGNYVAIHFDTGEKKCAVDYAIGISVPPLRASPPIALILADRDVKPSIPAAERLIPGQP